MTAPLFRLHPSKPSNRSAPIRRSSDVAGGFCGMGSVPKPTRGPVMSWRTRQNILRRRTCSWRSRLNLYTDDWERVMKRYIAEFIGTFVLVLGGCGSAVLAGEQIGFVGVALAFGLALLAMVYAIGPVSGYHINPAVTLGLFLSRKMDRRFAAGYVVAQILGGIAAAAVLFMIAQG